MTIIVRRMSGVENWAFTRCNAIGMASPSGSRTPVSA